MKELPILMNGEMVRAILDGKKTQTRRPWIKPKRHENYDVYPVLYSSGFELASNGFCIGEIIKSPFGAPGDRLWVRETWATDYLHDGIKPSELTEMDSDIFYRADGHIDAKTDIWVHCWRPSIHMPRWASRITLEITREWAERVQEISEDDAKAEGLAVSYDPAYLHRYDLTFRGGFTALWDSIYAAKGFGWNTNCWVWGCEFKVLEGAK